MEKKNDPGSFSVVWEEWQVLQPGQSRVVQFRSSDNREIRLMR